MNAFFSFLNKFFLIVAVIAIIIAVLAKIFGWFPWFGLFPLSYLRFTEVCLFFVIAISLYQMAGAKAPKKAAAKKRKR